MRASEGTTLVYCNKSLGAAAVPVWYCMPYILGGTYVAHLVQKTPLSLFTILLASGRITIHNKSIDNSINFFHCRPSRFLQDALLHRLVKAKPSRGLVLQYDIDCGHGSMHVCSVTQRTYHRTLGLAGGANGIVLPSCLLLTFTALRSTNKASGLVSFGLVSSPIHPSIHQGAQRTSVRCP